MKDGNHERLANILRTGLLRNLGGLGNACLYSRHVVLLVLLEYRFSYIVRVHIGTKKLIENYIYAVQEAIKIVLHDATLDVKKKFEFFWETRQSFGRSALLLSGGASLGKSLSSSFCFLTFLLYFFCFLCFCTQNNSSNKDCTTLAL
jgi:hypothetical protein